MTRRRFVAISASALGAAIAGLPMAAGAATPLTRWRGVALGAEASISLRHPEAGRIITACRAEIARLERIFSLYDAESVLTRLNADGRLDAPPFELLELLGQCDVLNAATGGLFDPTVQPLWAAYAEAFAGGRAPDADAIDRALERVGWSGVSAEAGQIAFARPGMAITLNGIAQGYVADRVAALLRAEGLTDVLVNTGEMRALGGHPDGGAWPVSFDDGSGAPAGSIDLRDAALASSAPLGTAFDAEGRVGHILDPRSGKPAAPAWRLVSVTARTAALADGLSTAFCLMSRAEIERTLASFPDAALAHLA
ncbi:MAG: FAD:protein FMN transferase [Rhizobiaceae bacterium]|nr:MAG: FAD:protein FMN transferase [Rhizobiaceae bacterium]